MQKFELQNKINNITRENPFIVWNCKLTDTFKPISSTFLLLFLTKFPNQDIISDNDVDNAAKDEDDNKTNNILGTESIKIHKLRTFWFINDNILSNESNT